MVYSCMVYTERTEMAPVHVALTALPAALTDVILHEWLDFYIAFFIHLSDGTSAVSRPAGTSL